MLPAPNKLIRARPMNRSQETRLKKLRAKLEQARGARPRRYCFHFDEVAGPSKKPCFDIIKLQSSLHQFIYPVCRSVPSRPASSRRASQPKPTSHRQADSGCTKSSTMAFGLSVGRTERECGSIAVPATI
jgi:hypothetical protein